MRAAFRGPTRARIVEASPTEQAAQPSIDDIDFSLGLADIVRLVATREARATLDQQRGRESRSLVAAVAVRKVLRLCTYIMHTSEATHKQWDWVQTVLGQLR